MFYGLLFFALPEKKRYGKIFKENSADGCKRNAKEEERIINVRPIW